jgi:hypothetical protein
MNAPILITGCARSGTSMVAGIVNICGAFGGKMSGPNMNNAKGMFENVAIRNTIVKPYFEFLGVDKLGQYPLPDINNLPIPSNWKTRVETVIREEGYKEGPWMYKGAKMCLHWPVWNYAFPDAKWLIVRRKTPDIINSCLKTGFMKAFNYSGNQKAVGANNAYDGWLWWVHQHEQRFIEMITEGLNVKIVWPERMITGDYSQMKDAMEWLGLEWQELKVVEFISPKLWKARRKVKPINIK